MTIIMITYIYVAASSQRIPECFAERMVWRNHLHLELGRIWDKERKAAISLCSFLSPSDLKKKRMFVIFSNIQGCECSHGSYCGSDGPVLTSSFDLTSSMTWD